MGRSKTIVKDKTKIKILNQENWNAHFPCLSIHTQNNREEEMFKYIDVVKFFVSFYVLMVVPCYSINQDTPPPTHMKIYTDSMIVQTK